MKIISSSVLVFFLLLNCVCFSQSEDENSKKKKSKFQTGLYLGSYFANKYTAALYDGYGYDADGKKNDFPDSYMYRRIVLEYGGGVSGQTDQVAQALGVNPGEWVFDQTDMPMNMKYNPAFMVGMQLNYEITKKDALVLNVNASKLTLNGNFTIVITTPPIGTVPPGYRNIQIFAITGGEKRLIFQTGYRKVLGNNDVFNFFIEGGPSLNMTKYLNNQATINNLHIDLGTYYNQIYYPTYHSKYLSGVGLGAFAGFGLNITANPNWSMQLLYSPSYEEINIGEATKPTVQNSLGIRVFYTML